MRLKPSKEALHYPSSLISAKFSSVLRLFFNALAFVRSYHIDILFAKIIIQVIAVICLVANKLLRLRFDHVKIKRQLDQSHFMMIRCMRTDRKRKPMPINDSHDLHTLATLDLADVCTTAFGRGNGGIDKAFPLIYLSLLSAHWQGLSGHYEPLRFCTSVENDDELFCNSESSEAACATVLQYSVSKEQRPKPYV